MQVYLPFPRKEALKNLSLSLYLILLTHNKKFNILRLTEELRLHCLPVSTSYFNLSRAVQGQPGQHPNPQDCQKMPIIMRKTVEQICSNNSAEYTASLQQFIASRKTSLNFCPKVFAFFQSFFSPKGFLRLASNLL